MNKNHLNWTENQVFSNFKLLRLWWVKNEMWDSFTGKQNEGWSHGILFLCNSVYLFELQDSPPPTDEELQQFLDYMEAGVLNEDRNEQDQVRESVTKFWEHTKWSTPLPAKLIWL